MKKIVFALQVFILTAVLPLCVILEMNHKNAAIPETNKVEDITGKVKAIPTAYTQTGRQNKNLVFRDSL